MTNAPSAHRRPARAVGFVGGGLVGIGVIVAASAGVLEGVGIGVILVSALILTGIGLLVALVAPHAMGVAFLLVLSATVVGAVLSWISENTGAGFGLLFAAIIFWLALLPVGRIQQAADAQDEAQPN